MLKVHKSFTKNYGLSLENAQSNKAYVGTIDDEQFHLEQLVKQLPSNPAGRLLFEPIKIKGRVLEQNGNKILEVKYGIRPVYYIRLVAMLLFPLFLFRLTSGVGINMLLTISLVAYILHLVYFNLRVVRMREKLISLFPTQ